MKTPIDIQKLRKKRQRTNRIRQITILLLIAFCIFAALYVNDLMVRKNVASQIGGIMDSVGGEGFPASIPSGRTVDLGHVDKNLAVLKDSNLYIYNPKGKQIRNIQQMTDRTVMKIKGDKLLVYNVGGRKISLHTATTETTTMEVDSNIISADIGHSGEIAVVTSPPNFVAAVNVYNDRGESIYGRTFSLDMVSAVAMSPKGKNMAVSSFGSQNGVLDFNVLIYELGSEKEAKTIPVGNRIILDMNYYQEDTMSILTDKDYLIYDLARTQLMGSCVFPESMNLIDYRTGENHILILGKDVDTREYILFLLSPEGKELGRINLEKKPNDFTFSNGKIYLLAGDRIQQYNYSMKLVRESFMEGIERLHIMGDQVYLLSKTEIFVLNEKEVA